VGKWPEPPQNIELLLAKHSDVGDRLGACQHSEQKKEQHLIKRINHLALLARICKVRKMIKKNNGFVTSTPERQHVLPCAIAASGGAQKLHSLSRPFSPDCLGCPVAPAGCRQITHQPLTGQCQRKISITSGEAHGRGLVRKKTLQINDAIVLMILENRVFNFPLTLPLTGMATPATSSTTGLGKSTVTIE
jgi:hypothetical protein